MTYQELEQQMMKLPADEREALAVRLLDSLDNTTVGALDPEWLAEIEKRYANYKSGATQGVPAAAVFQRIRERHGWN